MKNKISFKECMFDSKQNPAINIFKDLSIWIFTHVPDFGAMDGFKMLALRLFGFAYAFSLLGWLISEGITIEGMIFRILLMTAFFGVVYLSQISGMIYSLLFKWESFK